MDSIDEVLGKLENYTALVPIYLRRQMNENQRINIGRKIKEFYFNQTERSVIYNTIEVFFNTFSFTFSENLKEE